MLNLCGVDQRTSKAAEPRIKPPLIVFSFNLKSSRSLREIWLAAEPTSKEIPRMVKCQVVSLAKGNVAIVFPFAEKFFPLSWVFQWGKGRERKQSELFLSAHMHSEIWLLIFKRSWLPSPLLPVTWPGQPHLCQIKVKPLERHTVLGTEITKTPIHLSRARVCPSAVLPFKYSFLLLFLQETRFAQCLW